MLGSQIVVRPEVIVRLVDEGTFVDLADAARLLGFTRARITQLIDLTLLTPAIQEAVLFAEVVAGRDHISVGLSLRHGLSHPSIEQVPRPRIAVAPFAGWRVEKPGFPATGHRLSST
jgi:hypothetical protein